MFPEVNKMASTVQVHEHAWEAEQKSYMVEKNTRLCILSRIWSVFRQDYYYRILAHRSRKIKVHSSAKMVVWPTAQNFTFYPENSLFSWTYLRKSLHKVRSTPMHHWYCSFGEIWWDLVRFNEIQWDLVRFSEIWMYLSHHINRTIFYTIKCHEFL